MQPSKPKKKRKLTGPPEKLGTEVMNRLQTVEAPMGCILELFSVPQKKTSKNFWKHGQVLVVWRGGACLRPAGLDLQLTLCQMVAHGLIGP